jgi:hypothetical protein
LIVEPQRRAIRRRFLARYQADTGARVFDR